MEGGGVGSTQDETFLLEHVCWVCPANRQVSGYIDILYFVSYWHSNKVHEFIYLEPYCT